MDAWEIQKWIDYSSEKGSLPGSTGDHRKDPVSDRFGSPIGLCVLELCVSKNRRGKVCTAFLNEDAWLQKKFPNLLEGYSRELGKFLWGDKLVWSFVQMDFDFLIE